MGATPISLTTNYKTLAFIFARETDTELCEPKIYAKETSIQLKATFSKLLCHLQTELILTEKQKQKTQRLHFWAYLEPQPNQHVKQYFVFKINPKPCHNETYSIEKKG